MEWRIDPNQWDEAIEAADGPQVVVAGPGAGKTEFLVRRALHLIDQREVAPEDLLILSFSRRGAADLRTRVESALNRSFTLVSASTFHSFAYRLLETHGLEVNGWKEMPSLLTGPEQVALVRRLLAADDAARWPAMFRPMLGSHTLAIEVTDFILRAEEQLLSPGDVEERASGRDDWKALPEFLRQYRAELESIRRIDYGRLQSSAVELLADDDVAERTAGQFSHILVDEYQDTTVAQAEMLAGLYRPHRNLTVAGDPYQSIYSFRGAELRNIADFPDRFPDKEGKPAQRIVLTTSFRVPQAILEAAVRVTAGGELPGAAGPVISAPGTGTVETYGFSQAAAEAEWIAAEAERIRLLEGIPYSRMAVLVRSKRHLLVELSRALERRRIEHDVPDTRLADHGAVRLILDVVIAATDEPIERDRAMQRILLGPLFRLNLGSYREMQRERLRSGSSWADALGALEERAAPLAKLIENPRWATEMAAADGFWELWSALPQLENLVTEPARTGDRQAWSSFSQVLDRLRERDPLATLAQYLMLVESEEFEATPLLAFSGDRDRLTLTTLHQAKGLEWDVVFIAAAVEGVFPDLRPRDSLLSSRLLSPSQPQDPREYGLFRLQEEMRLAYTAMCRARTRVIWTATTAGVEEHQARPSRFLARVAGTSTADEALSSPQLSERMATALEVEAHLRRVVRDGAAAAPVRLAALNALSADGRHGMRSPERFAGVLERGSDKGLVPPQPTLSPSQAASYDICPRRYALERRLNVGNDTTVYLAFGTLIHDVLELAEKRAAQEHRAHADVEMALAALEDSWDPGPFGGGPWSSAWKQRAVDTVTHLYEHWPASSQPALALERDVEMPLGGLSWRGRIDRIETDGDALRIVDYKSSRTLPTKSEVAESLQLGFYALAAAAELAGEVEAAEFWYPAQTGRKSLATFSLDLDRLPEVTARLESAAEGIVAENWEPKPGQQCDRCRVRNLCPAWPEGQEAFS